MEIREYLLLVRKWLWLFIALTLASSAMVFVLSRNSTPIYQATAKLMVNEGSATTKASAYSDLLTSERLARTYANLLTSRPVLEETAQILGIEVKHFADDVTVTTVRDTQLLTIQVEGSNPALIAQIANTMPEVFIRRNRDLQLERSGEVKQGLKDEIDLALANIESVTQQLRNPADDAAKARLETSLAQYRASYNSLVTNLQQVILTEAQSLNNIVVAEPAIAPTTPIRPRTFTNTLLAAVVGALLALGIAFTIEYLDDTVKSPDDISRVTGLSTLGAISKLKDATTTRQLIAWLKTKSPEAESYRTLRTNIQFSSVDKAVRTLLVTSSSPGEGKSTTSANLAVVLAQTGQRVIVVDTDLRRPVQHKIFGVPNNTGLTTALLSGDGAAVDGQIQPTEIENLSVLTSGPIPPNPSELLGSHRMARLVAALAEQADIVIFDSPPVLAVTDAAVLGRQMDGVLLVADAGKTQEHALASSVNELRKTGTNVLGVALNRLDARRGGYYYYYYYASEDGPERQRRAKADKRRIKPQLRLPWDSRTA